MPIRPIAKNIETAKKDGKETGIEETCNMRTKVETALMKTPKQTFGTMLESNLKDFLRT